MITEDLEDGMADLCMGIDQLRQLIARLLVHDDVSCERCLELERLDRRLESAEERFGQ